MVTQQVDPAEIDSVRFRIDLETRSHYNHVTRDWYDNSNTTPISVPIFRCGYRYGLVNNDMCVHDVLRLQPNHTHLDQSRSISVRVNVHTGARYCAESIQTTIVCWSSSERIGADWSVFTLRVSSKWIEPVRSCMPV